MSLRDPIESALEPLTALERLFREWRTVSDPTDAHREAWEHIDEELARARTAIAEIDAQVQRKAEALGAQHAAALDLATHSTRAQVDIVAARATVSVEAARAQAEQAERERAAERERLLAEVAELRQEVEVLSSFDKAQALALYRARSEADEAKVGHARRQHDAACARVAKAEAEARRSGARTALEMAQMDIALEQARAARDGAERALRAAEATLDSTREKLGAWLARG